MDFFGPEQEGVIEDIRPGLARWVTRHPEWKPEEDFLDESYRDVASVLHIAPDALVLVDPLVPESLWPELDARIEAAGKAVVVLTTIHWHARSRDEIAKRYDARLGGELQGVRAFDAGRQDEVALWLEGARAVVLADAVVGDQQGGLRLSPWYKFDAERKRTRLALRPLLDLPIEIVLPAHGNPVLEDGHQALEKALEA
jgi:glyoxylase-like metal-dependent hydrolase (beta-lactamase superfamily II)